MTSPASISFILPARNGLEFLDACFEHLEAERQEDDEVILVDNGSTDGTLEAAKTRAGVMVLEEPGLTIAALRNRGAAAARHDLLAFIDIDCLLMPGWRDAVQAQLNDGAVAATGSRYDIPEDATWIERTWFAHRVPHAQPAHYINSGNLVVRRDAFEHIKGFDESLITDEDYDFGIRLREAGLSMIEDPAVRVIHLGNAKTVPAFYRKTCWHATSGMNLFTSSQQLDKPMVMTFAFIACVLAAAILLVTGSRPALSVLMASLVIIAIPTITTLYRALQHRSVDHFPQMIALHTVWYAARSVTFVKERLLP